MGRMHKPPHPGKLIREYLGEVSISDAATKLGLSTVTLQRVVNGSAGVSPDVAFRLSAALGTSPELWAGLQMQFDTYERRR